MARLNRLPFATHPALRLNLNQEGYANYTFGARNGPSVDFAGLCHELCHAAQFAPQDFEKRCTPWGTFHLPVKEVIINEESFSDPATAQCTLRECEVFAIQYQLQQFVGCKIDFAQYADRVVLICSHLPDWWTLGGQKGRATQIPVRLAEFKEQWSALQAIERITQWLDNTALRLSTLS
jgi:hypothetical protein